MYLSLTLFKPKKIRCTHYCIWAMRTHLIAGCFTLWPILAFIVAALNRAFHGVGHSGKKFALAEIKGDWPWLRKILRFDPSFTGNRVCFLCHATVWRDRNPFYEFDHYSEVSTMEYLGSMLDTKCSPSPLILVIGFSVQMIQICSMHTVNLGLVFTANGALLATLIRTGFYGCPDGQGAFEAALINAYDDFIAWRKANNVRSSQRQFKRSSVPFWNNICFCFDNSYWRLVFPIEVPFLGRQSVLWHLRWMPMLMDPIWVRRHGIAGCCWNGWMKQHWGLQRMICQLETLGFTKTCQKIGSSVNCLLNYLLAFSLSLSIEDRTLGKWLQNEVQAGRRDWPTDPLLTMNPLASFLATPFDTR